MNRREFLQTTAATASLPALSSASSLADVIKTKPLTIIDTHTHFYDPTRPEGVPWPNKSSPLYRTILPANYRKQKVPQPVTGTVVVEASKWLEDNQWILDLAKDDPFIVGFVGNISPAEPKFAQHLKRFAANPLFRGIRIRPFEDGKGEFTKELKSVGKHLANADLSVDTLGRPNQLPIVEKMAAAVPDLRIVIDHIANLKIDGKAPNAEWQKDMAAVAKHKNVYCKVSALVENTGHKGDAPADVDFYRPVLDFLWNTFGEQRLIYGSNWPVSDRGAPLHTVQSIVYDYFNEKGAKPLAAYFSGNAKLAYKWIDRSSEKS